MRQSAWLSSASAAWEMHCRIVKAAAGGQRQGGVMKGFSGRLQEGR